MPTTVNELEVPIARRTLQPDDCVLFVVDIQERLLPPIFNKDQLIRNAQLLIRLASILNLPVIATTQISSRTPQRAQPVKRIQCTGVKLPAISRKIPA